MAAKLARWFFFGVLIAVLPLVYSYGNLAMKSEPVTPSKIVNGGELLIIVWTLCAGAIGELFGNGSKLLVAKIISGGLCTVILVASAMFFASISEARVDHKQLDDQVILTISGLLFIFGFITCGSCMALSEAE